jgi:hypothetical protein
MDGQRVGGDHLDGAACLLQRERRAFSLRDELRCADIGDQERVRRAVAHDAVCAGELRVGDGSALAADTHRQPILLGNRGKPLVDRRDVGVAAGQ